ncbi:hypothetical protein A3C17_02560 [Candidatus Uhrbacteria bacterium RIFCSPHIGHO2_02_FULL_53_13]|uniref:Uncharacterized protein n=1 Tax=Candidatus Uhrbacteria bacterium RIFCSPHIGHO2_02_FULL_53_13 TaxID=1802389 RepID=A0A1F7TW22_9BACT|nr:MAG: hypothetical protein A3C17_02560 [Candidatus Uhrbacteria bacterium RIFCSPHIGHO2_02_FULL_53_13]
MHGPFFDDTAQALADLQAAFSRMRTADALARLAVSQFKLSPSDAVEQMMMKDVVDMLSSVFYSTGEMPAVASDSVDLQVNLLLLQVPPLVRGLSVFGGCRRLDKAAEM